MQQKLSVQLLIIIPESQVIIEKLELEELKKANLLGVYWSMMDLENRMGRKKDWIKQNVLYNPRFKSILDISCGGFVYYPQKKVNLGACMHYKWQSFSMNTSTIFLGARKFT
ncbi:DUF771 domain-containing protein [Lysinibacillus sphaericus]|uniref:DUF771 domain-containing protein n=1 Tax=Lysinibacillus sphaericus TaxID=1421 RepID=UPI003F570025